MRLLSASQLSLFTECQRKWGFKYIDRIQLPEKPGTKLGTEVHDEQLDPYLMQGREFDFTRPSGEIANKLRPLLPQPKTPGMRTKRWFEIPSPTGVFGYQGELDLYATDSVCVPGLTGGVPLIGDFKTTKDLDYVKTSEDLKTDFQAQIYSMAIMFQDQVDEADLVWFYTRTKGAPRAQRTHLRVVASHVAEQFQRIDELGAKVADIREAEPKVEELPPNPLMCHKFGGCPYISICNLSPSVFAGAINEAAVESKTAAFLAKMKKQVAPTEPVAQVVQPEPVVESVVAEKLPDWATAMPTVTATVDPLHVKAAPVAINPPESALPPAPPVESKKRGRPAKTAEAAPTPENENRGVRQGGYKEVVALADLMKENNIRVLEFDNNQITRIELFFEWTKDLRKEQEQAAEAAQKVA